MASLHERCQAAVANVIRALPLEDIDSSRVYTHLEAYDSDVSLPAVLVTIEAEAEELEALDTERDSKTLPVRIRVKDRTSPNFEDNRARYLTWREQLTSAFLCQRLGTVEENYGLDLRPEGIIEPNRQEYQTLESAFVVRCLCVTDRA